MAFGNAPRRPRARQSRDRTRVRRARLGAITKTNLLRVNAGRVLPQDHLMEFVPIVEIV